MSYHDLKEPFLYPKERYANNRIIKPAREDWNPMHSIAFIVYAGIVTVTSLYPGGDGRFDSLDKVAHLLVYYIFAVLAFRALEKKQYYALVCAGIILYSALLELGQSYVPGRDMSGYDLLANIGGVILGAVVMRRKYPSNR